MATTITFTDGTAQPSPIVAPGGQQVEFLDASAGLIVLAAVNRILEGIGEMPLTALNPGTDSLAGDAQRILEETTREILAEGWNCNTDDQQTFTAGSDGRVSLSGILSFQSQPAQEGRYALRAGYLYDRTTATDILGVGATVDLRLVIADIAFSDLPEPMRRHAITAAAVRFAQTKQGDMQTLNYLRLVADEARRAALRFDGDQSQRNLLQSVDVLEVKGIVHRFQ